MNNIRQKTVGEIVSSNFETSKVFQEMGIDFCCRGDTPFIDACSRAEVSPEIIEDKIRLIEISTPKAILFKEWPIDLLLDYIVKYHHRNVRAKGPKIYKLLVKVTQEHGDQYTWLEEICSLFKNSLDDLEEHLSKEEYILFPYLYDLWESKEKEEALPLFHCGDASSPINVMKYEHNLEGERFQKISKLTGNYLPRTDTCNSFRLVMLKLKQFNEDLHQHIHLENNIIFAESLKILSQQH